MFTSPISSTISAATFEITSSTPAVSGGSFYSFLKVFDPFSLI